VDLSFDEFAAGKETVREDKEAACGKGAERWGNRLWQSRRSAGRLTWGVSWGVRLLAISLRADQALSISRTRLRKDFTTVKLFLGELAEPPFRGEGSTSTVSRCDMGVSDPALVGPCAPIVKDACGDGGAS